MGCLLGRAIDSLASPEPGRRSRGYTIKSRIPESNLSLRAPQHPGHSSRFAMVAIHTGNCEGGPPEPQGGLFTERTPAVCT
jgi:hypothetical protein